MRQKRGRVREWASWRKAWWAPRDQGGVSQQIKGIGEEISDTERIRKQEGWQLFQRTIISLTGEGNGTPLQYSCLENPVDGGAWQAAGHRVANSQTQLSDFTFTFHFHALEKEMATHSSVLAWGIPGTGEPGWLPSVGSHRVGHD